MKLPPEVMSRLKAVQDGTFIPVPPPPEQLTAEEEKLVALEARRQEKRQRAADKRLGLREHIREDDLDVAIRIAARRREREVFYTMDSKAFEQFVQRRLAPELREGAPEPASWNGSPEEWESLRQQAEDVEREKLAVEFAAGIALRGLTPEEMATGTLDDGSEVYALSGKVKRPPAPALPAAMEEEALRLLEGLRARRRTLDTIQQAKLEQIAHRRWQGEVGPVEIVLSQAKGLIEAHDFQRRTAAVETQELPTLNILWPFRGPGGRTFSPGQVKATPELVEELQEWAERIETRAQGRTLSSVGFPQWPVFTVVNGVPA